MFFVPYLIGLIGLGLLEAGLLLTGAAVIGVALLTAHTRGWLADFLDRGPAVDVIEHVTPGLTDKEVEEFTILHREYLQIKDEKREEMQKEARQNNGGGHLNKQ